MTLFGARFFIFIVLATTAPGQSQVAEKSAQSAKADPHERVMVTDPKSGIAGAELFQIGPDGRLKDSDADWVMPLDHPDWRAAAAADHMKPEDPVLGVYYRGKSWALPWWIMKNHHVANLILEGRPVVIAFCEVCSSAIARDPVMDGRRLTFHLAGIYNGSILLADDQTKSYWTPFTGEALEGPLKGSKLKQLEVIQCRWRDWLELHPQTLVASAREDLRTGHGSRHSPGRPGNPFVRFLLKPLDERLGEADAVLGIARADIAKAYPLAALDALTDSTVVVLNEKFGKDDIVILHQRGSWLTTVFDRKFRAKTLRFNADPDGRIVDSNYHAHWNYEGEALDGPVAGAKLRSIPSHVEEWYIWAAFHPATSIYERPVNNAPATDPTSPSSAP